MTNLEWFVAGNTGCCFATLFVKNLKKIGWRFIFYTEFQYFKYMPETNIISIDFPIKWDKLLVKQWALANGFYIEDTSDKTEGLRIKCSEGIAWVQYFGPDSHVKTRQSPYPMLMYCNKLGKAHYIKVGFKGILHLAHAWIDNLKSKSWDTLWNQSYKQTKKILGHKPTINEASKTTWLK
jgi:hypothetical protein